MRRKANYSRSSRRHSQRPHEAGLTRRAKSNPKDCGKTGGNEHLGHVRLFVGDANKQKGA